MNCITIEFCAEDRARIDRLIEALERKACDRCVASALTFAEQAKACQETATQNGLDPIQQKLADTLAKASDPIPTPVASDDLPWGDPAPSAPAPEPVDLAEFQKALTLRCAESETTKAKVRALLHEYAAAASQVPEEKRAEVLERLAKL